MPLARQKSVGGLPILSQSVAIGRDDWSRLVAPIGRNRSLLVAIGRADWSRRLVAIGRDDWSRLVAIWRAGARRFCRDWSRRLVAIGRNRSRRRQGARHKKNPIPNKGESGLLLLLGVARFYASTNSSHKYMCKRSKRSTRSGASMVHRDAIVWPSAYCALYLTKHAHSWAIIKAILKSD